MRIRLFIIPTYCLVISLWLAAYCGPVFAVDKEAVAKWVDAIIGTYVDHPPRYSVDNFGMSRQFDWLDGETQVAIKAELMNHPIAKKMMERGLLQHHAEKEQMERELFGEKSKSLGYNLLILNDVMQSYQDFLRF